MSVDPITAALNLGKVAIEKIFPDPQQRAEATLRLEKLHQDGNLAVMQSEVQLLLGQIEINKIEAASDSLFKSGWRPAVGWACVIGLFYSFLLRPIMSWVILLLHSGEGEAILMPALNMGDLITLLGGLLGLGTLRTFEKTKGVASK